MAGRPRRACHSARGMALARALLLPAANNWDGRGFENAPNSWKSGEANADRWASFCPAPVIGNCRPIRIRQ